MPFTARSLNNCILFTGQKPYYITTDNGREFTGKDFTDALNYNCGLEDCHCGSTSNIG